MRNNHKRGFTLSELLIVVAIIGVLVAISIPIFTSQLHKAEVATDWANVRAYYAQIQYEFIETNEINASYLHSIDSGLGLKSFEMNGQTISLKAGSCYVAREYHDNETTDYVVGYNVLYMCDHLHEHPQCELLLPDD